MQIKWHGIIIQTGDKVTESVKTELVIDWMDSDNGGFSMNR